MSVQIRSFNTSVDTAVQRRLYLNTRELSDVQRGEKVKNIFQKVVTGRVDEREFAMKLNKLAEKHIIGRSQVGHIIKDFRKAIAQAPRATIPSHQHIAHHHQQHSNNVHTPFVRADYDTSGVDGRDLDNYYDCENCCSFPLLALAFHKVHRDKDYHSICVAMNNTDRRLHTPPTLTIADIEQDI